MRRQLPQKILFLNRDKGIRENRIPFSEFYSSISSAMTVRIAITTGIHFPRLISFPSYLAMKRGSSAIPFDVFSKTWRYPRRKPQSAQSAGIRHAFLLKAPSSSPNSAGASCGNVSMTRLAWGSKLRCSNTWCRVRNICLFGTPLQDGLFRRISDFPGGRGLMLSAR